MAPGSDSGGGFYAPSGSKQHDEDDTCGEAVMASMKAISRHCGADGVPLQTSSGVVVMAPQEEMEKVRNASPGEMSDEEVLRMVEDSPWLSEWAGALCSRAGLSEGTRQYEECLLNYARDVLGT